MSINTVSFGGKRLENSVVDGGKSEFFYFNAGSNNDWFNINNWYKNTNFTIKADRFPGTEDIVVVTNNSVSSSRSETINVGYLRVERNISRYDSYDQWSESNPGNFEFDDSININVSVAVVFENVDRYIGGWTFDGTLVNYATITCPSITFNTVSNYGTLNGAVTFNSNVGATWDNDGTNFGAINGVVVFNDNTANNGTINSSSATFNGNAYNRTSGLINGSVNFTGNGYSWNYISNEGTIVGSATFNSGYNNGTITGDATFHYTFNAGTVNNGIVVFNNSAYNAGALNNCDITFNNSSYGNTWSSINGGTIVLNNYSTLEGTVTSASSITLNHNSIYYSGNSSASSMTFNDSSYSHSWAYFYATTCIFNDNSHHEGDLYSPGGSVTFNNNSYTYYGWIGPWDVNVTFNDSSYNGQGSWIDGNIIFNNISFNRGFANYATFNDNSYNTLSYGDGTCYTATFNDSSFNSGYVDYIATFNDSSTNYSGYQGYWNNPNGNPVETAIFNNTSSNNGVVYDGTFNDYSTNTMAVDNIAIFNDNSSNNSTTNSFGGNTNGRGIENGSFYESSTNNGIVYNATFYGSSSNSSSGTVEGTATFNENSSNFGAADAVVCNTTGTCNAGEPVSLLLHGDGTNSSTTFTDSSTYNLTPSSAGSTIISTTQSKFGGSSIYFDGSGSGLTYSENARFTMPGDFTAEAWIYYQGMNSSYSDCQIMGCHYAGIGASWLFMIHSNNNVTAYINGTTVTSISPIVNNTWTHVAMVRHNGYLSLYIDGVNQGSTPYVPDSLGVPYAFTIGNDCCSSYRFIGYMDEIRVARTAIYTSNFIPVGYPVTILSMSNSTSYGQDDSSFANSLTNNNVTVDPSTNSLSFNGSLGSYFYVSSDNSMFNLGIYDFTIDVWAYFNTITGTDNGQHIIEFRNNGEGGAPTLYLYQDTLYWYVNGSNIITASSAISYNTWHHISVSRLNGITRLFLNGVQTGSDYADSTDYTVQSNRPVFGVNTTGGAAYLDGFLDDIKIIKYQGRTSDPFTPAARST